MRRTNIIAAASAAAVLALAPLPVLPQASGGPDDTAIKIDRQFVDLAIRSGIAEVREARLALRKSTNSLVRATAQKMIDDHATANTELAAIAQQQNIAYPTEPSAKETAQRESLETLSGAAFDQAYLNDQVADHHKTIAIFRDEVAKGNDEQIKTFAATTLPKLQSHLAMVHHDLGAL